MNDRCSAERFNSAAERLGEPFAQQLCALPEAIRASAQEIRIRRNRPIMLRSPQSELFVLGSGMVSRVLPEDGSAITGAQIERMFASLCDYSVHSVEHEIRRGFLTVRGGHRAGFCGTAVLVEGSVRTIRDVSSICLRIAREHIGAADRLIASGVMRAGGGVILAGPPGCGKTTVLRDLARQLSSGALGRRLSVAVVDERGEIAGVYRGETLNALGPCCDCLDGYPKAAGIMHALRALTPDVIVCDEVAEPEELAAVADGLCAGVAFVTSIHLGSIEELSTRSAARALLATGGFQAVAVMKGRGAPGEFEQIMVLGKENEDYRHFDDRSDLCAGRDSQIGRIGEAGKPA